MKIFHMIIVSICWLGTIGTIYSDTELDDPGYQNKILTIDEFETPTAYKIVITFEQENPVCFYAPQNFEETLDDTIYRALMPRTTIAPDVQTSFEIDDVDGDIELLLSGVSIDKYIGNNHIIFVIPKKMRDLF